MSKINTQELQDLLQGSASKDENKFNQFYKTYQGLIYGIAFSILKNKENAEDLVQIVCTKIWDMKPENLPNRKPATWLYTLTKNETLNFLRKQKNTVSMEDIYSIGEEDANLDDIVEKESYNKILSRLEPQDQEIVSLKVLSGLSFRKISQILDMPIGTVQWKYYKALHTLKMLLANLSMFIVAILTLALQKIKRPKSAEKEETPVEPIQNTTEEEKEETSTSRDEQKKEMNQIAESLTVNELENGNTIQENTLQIVERPSDTNKTEVATFGVASFFLLFTILFAIIFTKHQQNRKKHVSK